MTDTATDVTQEGILTRICACEASSVGVALLSDPLFAEFYPLLRQRVISENHGLIQNLHSKPSKGATLRGLWNIVRNEGIAWNRKPTQQSDLVVLSYTTSRTFKLPAGWPDAYAEPFVATIEGMGGSASILEVPAMGEYRTPPIRRGFLLGRDALVAKIKARLWPREAPLLDEVRQFAQLCQEHGLVAQSVSGKSWSRVYNQFVQRRALFTKQLRTLRPKFAIVVTWYGTTSMAFTSAAKKMDIPVADLQHGVQGAVHWMYSSWPKETLTSSVMPSAFLNWGDADKAHLETWISDKQRSYVCGVPWFQMNPDLLKTSPDYMALEKAAAGKPVVLVTLQSNPDAILDYVEQALQQEGAAQFAWAIRCHPSHIHQCDIVESRFAGYSNVLPCRASTLAPLNLILGLSVSHVTEFSSVVKEAASIGVPSVCTTDFGRQCFRELDDEDISVIKAPEALIGAIIAAQNGARQDNATCDDGNLKLKQALLAYKKDADENVFSV